MVANQPRFDCEVGPDGGYVWWYIDAISDDGAHGFTLIAFIGSVFSPYYAWSNWDDPFAHCAINIALYDLKGHGGRWAMTERSAKHVTRDATHFKVGPSGLRWDNGKLFVDINEIGVPIPSRISGTIAFTPSVTTTSEFILDARGQHFWQPLAPRGRVEVLFSNPSLTWSGDGYFDTNRGHEPLERGFQTWHWGRTHRQDDVMLFYDSVRRDGSKGALALLLDSNGDLTEVDTPPVHQLPKTFWQVDRLTWADASARTQIIKTLEDTPFYARSALRTQIGGQQVTMMHESLDLDRLKNPIVRAMLPFRMPRRA